MKTAIENATKYANERGYKFVKLASNWKNPVEKDWPNRGCSDANIIATWKNNNIGLLAGKVNNITVADIDSIETLELLKSQFGPLPRTFTQKTRGGGVHLIFQHVEGIKNAVKVKIAGIKSDLDFRNDGGQIAFAGSTIDGKKYEIIDDSTPTTMPDWLKNLGLGRNAVTSSADGDIYDTNAIPDVVITPPAQRGGGDVGAAKLVADAIAKMQNAIADKNRNDTLNATCFTIGGLVGPGRISNDDATQYVEQLKQIAIAKGLPFGEAERTAKSGFEGGIGKPLHNRPMTRAATTPAADEDIKIDVTHTIDLSSFAATDYDNAKVFVLLYPDKYRYTSAAGWYRYDEKTGIWRHDDAEAILAKDIADMLEMRQIDAVKARKNDIVSFCKPNAGRIASTRTILESLCFYDYLKFDQNHNFVCCRNGVIDLEKGLLHPHSPEWGFTASLTANLNPDADERLIDDFLMESVKGGEAVVKWFQKTGGSHLTGETRTEAATFVWGPSRAGKGSYVEALKALMGDLCRTLSFSALVEKRDPDSSNFDLAPLRGARLVIADESNRKDRLNGGKLKAMTGGTEINCSFKGKDFFTYQPKFKIMMISNWPPNCDPDDDAAWGRLRVVEFPNSHLGSEDVTIKTRLKTRERQEALLKWLVLGAMAMYAENDGHIMPVPQIATSTNEARNALDTIAQWLDQCTIKRDDLYTESSKLYQNYAQWAENMGYEAKSARNLMSTLRAKGYDTSAQRKVNGVNLRSCNGIGLLI